MQAPTPSCGFINEFLGAFESGIDLRRIFAAGLGEIRSSATATTDHGSEFLDNISGLVTFGEVFCHRSDEVDVGFAGAGQHNDPGA